MQRPSQGFRHFLEKARPVRVTAQRRGEPLDLEIGGLDHGERVEQGMAAACVGKAAVSTTRTSAPALRIFSTASRVVSRAASAGE